MAQVQYDQTVCGLFVSQSIKMHGFMCCSHGNRDILYSPESEAHIPALLTPADIKPHAESLYNPFQNTRRWCHLTCPVQVCPTPNESGLLFFTIKNESQMQDCVFLLASTYFHRFIPNVIHYSISSYILQLINPTIKEIHQTIWYPVQSVSIWTVLHLLLVCLSTPAHSIWNEKNRLKCRLSPLIWWMYIDIGWSGSELHSFLFIVPPF